MLRLTQRSTPARSAWVRCSSTTNTQPTTSSEATSSSPPPSDDKKTSPSLPSNWKTRRPHINPERPRQWNRPLATGVLPAFDEALRYIRQDSRALRAEAQYNRSALREAESSPNPDPELIKSLEEKLAILEVQSDVNRPEVRWNFRNGLGERPLPPEFLSVSSMTLLLADMTKPVYRHLAEKKWRDDGDLDLLVRRHPLYYPTVSILTSVQMERIHQMNVVPDVLPSLHPSLDLRLTFPEPPPQSIYLRTRSKRQHKQVEPGVFLISEQV